MKRHKSTVVGVGAAVMCLTASTVASAQPVQASLGVARASATPRISFSGKGGGDIGPAGTYKQMTKLKAIAAEGHGKIAVLLPTTNPSRFVTSDAPDFAKAFAAAGLSKGDYEIENAGGSGETQITQAEAAITGGATVLVLDTFGFSTGGTIQRYAAKHGVPVIDYDSIVAGSRPDYFVSFNNFNVGKLQAQGLISCINKWHVKNPHVYELEGTVGDPVAADFAKGANSVLNPLFKSGKYTKVAEYWDTDWSADTAKTQFQQAFRSHPDINAVLAGADVVALPVSSVIKDLKIPPKRIPVTGQDGELPALQNILEGYQCMTVYKPIFEEAAATAALALTVRAHAKAPVGLINGTTKDVGKVPSVLLRPISVMANNIKSTVVKDNYVNVHQLCAGSFAGKCRLHGIKP